MSRRWLAAGVVEAPVRDVFAALLEVGPVPHAHLNTSTRADSDGILRYRAPTGGSAYTVTVELDQNRHTLAVQGHWWYRGVYSVRDSPYGSLVEYRVHNVATRGRWAVPLMQRRLPQQMRRDLAALLRTIGQRLGRPAHLSPDVDHDGATP
jgi:hypothetical protein